VITDREGTAVVTKAADRYADVFGTIPRGCGLPSVFDSTSCRTHHLPAKGQSTPLPPRNGGSAGGCSDLEHAKSTLVLDNSGPVSESTESGIRSLGSSHTPHYMRNSNPYVAAAAAAAARRPPPHMHLPVQRSQQEADGAPAMQLSDVARQMEVSHSCARADNWCSPSSQDGIVTVGASSSRSIVSPSFAATSDRNHLSTAQCNYQGTAANDSSSSCSRVHEKVNTCHVEMPLIR